MFGVRCWLFDVCFEWWKHRTLNIEHRTSTLWPIALVFLAWALIYLPGLGTLEIKGEEGRRILPAIAMLESGNFVVPQVGSDPYFNKPPLVNWLVAASFKLFGQRNEWAARIPSALCVLLVAVAFTTVGCRSLGPNGSVAAALIWLTNLGILEKGRLIEIEALYVSLAGLAFIGWLSWWGERRSRWLTWVVPWIALGFGLLAKGPVHLVFFYAVVIAVLYRSGELRAFWNPAHAVGVVVMLAIFAAWAVPCLIMMRESNVAHTWTRQFSGRLAGEDFVLAGWLMNIPRGLGYFLPWTLLLPFARPGKLERPMRPMASGLIWGIALSFLGVNLLPGALARYTMPLLVPAAWLLALLLSRDAFELPRRWRAERLPMLVAAVAAVAIAVYAFVLMPRLRSREKVRNIAAQINAALPAVEPLYAVDPDYQPFLFYVRDPIVYVPHSGELPASARYILVQPDKEDDVIRSRRSRGQDCVELQRLTDYRRNQVVLLQAGERP